MEFRALRLAALLAVAVVAPLVPAGPAAAAPPPITGWVRTADGGPSGALALHLRAGDYADVAPVDSTGRFTFELPPGVTADSLDLWVDARDPAQRRYHPAAVRLHRSELQREQRVVLVPRHWTVGAGRYAGARVEISLERAYRPPCTGCSAFFRRAAAVGSGVVTGGVPGWPLEHFPLRVAFDRARSDRPVTARDSAAFWTIVDEVEAVVGRTLFRPAPYPATLPVDDEGPNDVILVWVVPSIGSPGRGTVGFYREDIATAALWVRSTRLFRDRSGAPLLMHELMHTLGFGHTCSWRSILWDQTRCPAKRSTVPTPEDVAYLELALAVNELTRGIAAHWGIEAAYAGEMGVLRGLAARGDAR